MGVIIGIWNIIHGSRAIRCSHDHAMPLRRSEVLGYTADSALSGATPLVFAQFCEDALTSYPACTIQKQ